MIKFNKEQLVMQSVQGKVHPPIMKRQYRVGSDGRPWILPATGGITYNFQIGDGCMGLAGDHVEPGVSTKNPDPAMDMAYNTLTCVGNQAKVITGEAKGAVGYVTGKHGGIDHVMIAFEQEVLEKLTIDDQFLVKACGQGMTLTDYPEIAVMNLDPELLNNMGIEDQDGCLVVPVTKVIPAALMGSGLGSDTMLSGDYDIMTRDAKSFAELGLQELRFGDIVMIQDHCNDHGPDYCQGAVTIGVIIHGDSYISGHGPGVTVLMSCRTPKIKAKLDPNANLANYLNFKK